MSATAADYGHTRAAERNRAAKAGRLAVAAAAAGVSLCELRSSHPAAPFVRAGLLRDVGAASASAETWALVYGAHLQRLAAVPGVQMCRDCGVPVLRAVGQRSPVLLLEPLAHPAGDLRLAGGHPPLAEHVPEAQRAGAAAAGTPLYRPHHLACSTATAVVRRLPRSRRCPICQHALAWWVRDAEYVAHPACEGPDPTGHARTTERTAAP